MIQDTSHTIDHISQINPSLVHFYLKKNNWLEVESKRSEVGIFQKFLDNDFAEIILPKDKDLLDYNRAMFRVAETIAATEQRPVDSVIHDLLLPTSDKIHFQFFPDDVSSVQWTLNETLFRLENIKKLLTIAACEVVEIDNYSSPILPEKVTRFIANCYLDKIEKGGITINFISEKPSFSKQVLEYIMESVKLIKENGQQEEEDNQKLNINADFIKVFNELQDLGKNDSNDTIKISLL